MKGKNKVILTSLMKLIYKIHVLHPLSANDISVDEFLFRETQILFYQGVNMQHDTQGLTAQVIIFDMLSLVLLVLLCKGSFLYLNNYCWRKIRWLPWPHVSFSHFWRNQNRSGCMTEVFVTFCNVLCICEMSAVMVLVHLISLEWWQS